MPDREKVINGLFGAIGLIHGYIPKKVWINGDAERACRDAIALLKEQEAKPVKVVKNAYNHEFYHCPRCDRSFYELFVKPKFCDKCGQAVKWDA